MLTLQHAPKFREEIFHEMKEELQAEFSGRRKYLINSLGQGIKEIDESTSLTAGMRGSRELGKRREETEVGIDSPCEMLKYHAMAETLRPILY